jgi:hypothetical protein
MLRAAVQPRRAALGSPTGCGDAEFQYGARFGAVVRLVRLIAAREIDRPITTHAESAESNELPVTPGREGDAI